ncbi:MAG: TonB-dependent receptor [Caulobacteraceae bacterium]|nr:TonB-dependent receptor [Caulobacteraceae bacterium]
MTGCAFRKRLTVAGGSVLALATALAFTHAAVAADAASPASATAAAGAPIEDKEVSEVVVTAVRGQAAEVAPVKSSLAATEPQAVITRKFIEEWAPRVGDFTTSAALAPSMVATPNPNGPGATDGGKIAMRGFQDGQFNVTYDGIAWGDTNGPSHHANSFFPSSTIGGIVIDRGPGDATDLGQANFGGSLNLFSLPFEDHWSVRQTATAASFGTYQGVTTLATGPIASWHDANLVLNFMEYQTNGYLTNSPSAGFNQFIKFTVPVTNHFSVTALYTRNYDDYHQSDSSSPGTVADTEAYGKRFALGNNPNLQNYWKYNYTTKQSDFGYIRENADFGQGFSAENTSYTYWYTNSTMSGNATQNDATVGAAALAKADVVVLTPQATYPQGGKGYTDTVYGLPGYLKRNEYRVRGDVLKFYKDFDFGRLTVGAMYEMAQTERSRFDIDLLTQRPDYREKAALFPGPSGCGSLPVQVAPGKTWNGACQVPLNIAYDEYSGWHQYQPFIQFEWRPIEGLTVTPGVKYVHFQLYVAAPVEAVSGSLQPSYSSGTYTKTLPFLTVNYHVNPHWSVYAQYAQGFLVPNIGAFYVTDPSQNKVVPQESTNYQVGTVFSAGKLTFDADLYYIDFKHKIQTETDLTTNETFESNSGGATYYGVEGEATYVLPAGFSVFGNFSTNSAVGKDDAVNPGNNGHQLALVPYWTGALGARFEHRELFRSDDDLVVAVDEKEIGPQYALAASGATAPTGKIHAFGQADLTTTYKLGNYAIEFQVLNLADSQSITSFKGKALQAGTNLPATTVAQGGAANVFTYQVGRSYQVTLKAAF